MPVKVGDPYYVEHDTSDVEATRALLEAAHGWKFGDPDLALGGSIVAKLPGGGRCGVRAPLRPDESPVTRVYVRVESVARTVTRARKRGAEIVRQSTCTACHAPYTVYLYGLLYGIKADSIMKDEE